MEVTVNELKPLTGMFFIVVPVRYQQAVQVIVIYLDRTILLLH